MSSNISTFQCDQDRELVWKPAKADAASSLNIVICFYSCCFVAIDPISLFRSSIGSDRGILYLDMSLHYSANLKGLAHAILLNLFNFVNYEL